MENDRSIVERTYEFAIRIVAICRYLTTDAPTKDFVLSKQLLRSGTSIGANVEEAQHPQSMPDFISKMSISLKETRESSYWLRLLRDTGYLTAEQVQPLLDECHDILHILIAIVNTANKKLEKKKA